MTDKDKQVLASIDDLSDFMSRNLSIYCIKFADHDGDDNLITVIDVLKTIRHAYTSLIKENDELKGGIVSLWKANTELIKGGWGH